MDWYWSWNSNILNTWCEELTHWKRPWCWERLKVGGEGDNRGWDAWMVSPTQWTWVWVSSGRWWWTGRPGMLQSMGSQRVAYDWATELNWTDCVLIKYPSTLLARHLVANIWKMGHQSQAKMTFTLFITVGKQYTERHHLPNRISGQWGVSLALLISVKSVPWPQKPHEITKETWGSDDLRRDLVWYLFSFGPSDCREWNGVGWWREWDDEFIVPATSLPRGSQLH